MKRSAIRGRSRWCCPHFATLYAGYKPETFRDGTNPFLDNFIDRTIFLLILPRYEGRFAIVTIRGAGCGGRLRRSVRGCEKHRERRRRSSGRPKSRGPGVAVLTSKGAGGSVVPVAVEVTHDPERWRKSRPPGRARNKPFQPLRAERRMPPARPWRRHSCAFYFAHEAADALAHPAFRAPSILRGRDVHRKTRTQSRREIAKLYLEIADVIGNGCLKIKSERDGATAEIPPPKIRRCGCGRRGPRRTSPPHLRHRC